MKDLQPFANSVASYLGIPSSSPLSSPSNSDNNLSVAVCKSRKILLLGCQGETLAAQVMDRLFFVTPPTATSFIYNDTYKPLFSTAKLTKLEIPSYSTYHHRKSQQFRHADRRQQQQSMIIRVHEGMKNQVLEGMRIESDGILEYKCFGDSRLTFVQMESKPYSPQGDEFYDYFEPLQRVRPLNNHTIIVRTLHSHISYHSILIQRLYSYYYKRCNNVIYDYYINDNDEYINKFLIKINQHYSLVESIKHTLEKVSSTYVQNEINQQFNIAFDKC